MRWMVAGSKGMLGQDVVAELARRGQDVLAVDRDEVDIVDPVQVREVVTGCDVVVNCAAYTAVDAAEQDEATAFSVNAVGAATLARAAARVGARMVQVSTDYVFDGHSATPYREDDDPAPASAYGRTKLAGEWAVRAEAVDHLIVRTAWLYGAHGACFPKTVLRVIAERGGIDVVTDQRGQPTWTGDLAELLVSLVVAGAPAGTYHGTSSGLCSWYEFARAVVAAAGGDPEVVHPTDSAAYVRPAPRPAYSVLGHDALVGLGPGPIGPWQERWSLASANVLGS